MKKNKKIFIEVLVALFLIACVLSWAFNGHKLHKEHKSKYLVTHPWEQKVNINNEYVAQIRAIQHIELRSLEKGYLQQIYVDEGQFVKKGQKMFQIMPLLLESELAKAQAEYDISRIEYENTKRLEDKKIVSINELALAKAKLDKSNAKLKLAQSHLQLSTVKAPFGGLMGRFRVRLGSLIEEGQLLTTISDTSKVWVYFNVSEVDYLDLMAHKNANNAKIKLQLANGKMFKYPGKIDTVEAEFNNQTGNIAFRASFPNPDGVLRHGQTGNIVISEKIDKALVIPQKATFEVLDKQYVYIIDKDNRIRARQIKVAHELPHLYVIKSGLQKADRILLDGLGRLEEGQKISTHMQKKDDVKASLVLPVE